MPRQRGAPLTSCRRDHGAWDYRIDIGNDPKTGRRKQIRRAGFRTRSDALMAMTQALSDLNRGTWVDDDVVTLGQWLTDWLNEVEQRRAVKTLANYRGHVRDVWAPRLGHLRLREVRRHHIEKVLGELAHPVSQENRQGNLGRRVNRRSGATIEGYRRTIRAALAVAQCRDLIAQNPAEGRMDSIPDRSPRELTIWEPEETAIFLGHVAGDRLAALYELAAYGGLRRAELCGLRWQDLDADGGGLVVRQTIVEAASKDVRPKDRVCLACGREHIGLLAKEPEVARRQSLGPAGSSSPSRSRSAVNRSPWSAKRAGMITLITTWCSARSSATRCGPGRSPQPSRATSGPAGYR